MELCMHKKAVFFLPVNILTVWSPAFLAALHTTVCLDVSLLKILFTFIGILNVAGAKL